MSRGPIPDDFEYPTAQRETLWTMPNKKRATMVRQSEPRDPNNISDISGATHGTTATYAIMKSYTNKPNLYDSGSVEGARPKRLVPLELGRNNPLIDKSLMTKDLGPAAAPNAQPFQTKRCTDPLVPNYPIAHKSVSATVDPTNTMAAALTHDMTLRATNNNNSNYNGTSSSLNGTIGGYSASNPGTTAGIAPLRRFKGDVKDVLKVDDIYGTKAADNRSNIVIRTHSPARDPINYNDVPLSTAGASRNQRAAKNPYPCSMSLHTADICKNDVVTLQSNRNTNPLSPTYTVTGPKGAPTSIGEVSGSKPRPAAVMRTDRPMLSLRSDDIEGAQPLKRFGDALTSGPVRGAAAAKR